MDLTTCRPPNPTPFVFEWQRLIDQQPQLAQAALLDAFVRPDADWSFVNHAPGWDDTKYNAVALFIFARENIEGREPRFAARDLLPIFHRFLTAAAARAPTQAWFDVTLPRTAYDFPTSTFRFYPTAQSGQQLVAVDKLDILPTHNSPTDLVDLPVAVRGMANYTNASGAPANSAPPPPVLHGAPSAMVLPQATPWQSVLVGTWFLTAPSFLSLDRDLQIASLPIDASHAEALLKKYPYPTLTARVHITIDHALTYKSSTIPPRADQPAATSVQSVLAARVQRVDILVGVVPLAGSDPATAHEPDLLETFK